MGVNPGLQPTGPKVLGNGVNAPVDTTGSKTYKNIARVLFVGPYYWKMISWAMLICIVVFALTLIYFVAHYSGKGDDLNFSTVTAKPKKKKSSKKAS